MKDLTQDSILRHIVVLATPVALGMLTQLAYHLIDLYFVSKLGAAAIAGVNAAGNMLLVVTSLTTVLASGTASVVSNAVGRKDRDDANLLFNQSTALSLVIGSVVMMLLYLFAWPYLQTIAADEATVQSGLTFTIWVLPGYALLLPWTAISGSLRGTGIAHLPILTYALSVVINALLAPILIAGWGTGVALGVQGAGLATTTSICIGLVILILYLQHTQRYLQLSWALMRIQWLRCRSIISIGLPTGADFALTFLSTTLVYSAIRDFGPSAQAGFGIGWRVLQAILLPGIAIGFAAGPIAGQNFGARNRARVLETFQKAALLGTAVMVATAWFTQWHSGALLALFQADAQTLTVATVFLQFMSWSFVAQGLVYICANMFQGLGNTMPALIGSLTRFVAFAASVVGLSLLTELRIEQVWQWLVASILLQAIVSLWLLRVEFSRRLAPAT